MARYHQLQCPTPQQQQLRPANSGRTGSSPLQTQEKPSFSFIRATNKIHWLLQSTEKTAVLIIDVGRHLLSRRQRKKKEIRQKPEANASCINSRAELCSNNSSLRGRPRWSPPQERRTQKQKEVSKRETARQGTVGYGPWFGLAASFPSNRLGVYLLQWGSEITKYYSNWRITEAPQWETTDVGNVRKTFG